MSFFIDVQGTLISDSDKSPINGAIELIKFLNQKSIPYIVITNNTKKTSNEFLKELREKGLEIKDNHYLDPFCVLSSEIPPTNAALFGADEFKKTMQKLGYIDDKNSTNAVMVASYDNFEFSEFASMIELIQKGAKFIPLHETSIYKKNGRLYPGVGAIAKMIKDATGAKYEAIGKPSEKFYREALRLINLQKSGLNFEDIVIISDDAKGDLVGAKELGMSTILVLSGKVDSAKNSGVDSKMIDKIYKDAGEFLGEISEKY